MEEMDWLMMDWLFITSWILLACFFITSAVYGLIVFFSRTNIVPDLFNLGVAFIEIAIGTGIFFAAVIKIMDMKEVIKNKELEAN